MSSPLKDLRQAAENGLLTFSAAKEARRLIAEIVQQALAVDEDLVAKNGGTSQRYNEAQAMKVAREVDKMVGRLSRGEAA